MSAWVVGILGSIAAAALVGVIVRLREVWKKSRFRRLAWGHRRNLRRQLATHLEVSHSHRAPRLTRRRIGALGRSFRLRPDRRAHVASSGQAELDAQGLIRLVANRDDRVYLVNAESGYGKTVLGMTLELLPRCNDLIPIYVDLGHANEEVPVLQVRQILDRIGDAPVISGRPLLVLDALNEAVDPVRFCEDLAHLGSRIRAVRASLLFLFSFRHRSYPGRLRAALRAHGLGPLMDVELVFDERSECDLSFFTAAQEQELRQYIESSPRRRFSRTDINAFLEWRDGASPQAEISRGAPSPASLRFARAVGSCPETTSPSLDLLSDIAFRLLSREMISLPLAELISSDQVDSVPIHQIPRLCGMERFVSCDATHLRFDGEGTVRILAAISVARSLASGVSPSALRGRTAYDVCAPYLQPALEWMLEGLSEGLEEARGRVGDAICEALAGPDAPYSFYATALCSETSGVFGDRRGPLDAALFEGAIEAIDRDRAEACRGSLAAVGRAEPQPSPDPVLDQLFEVMAAYGRGAVELLLQTMDDSRPLVRSQAAYLLLDWVVNVPAPPDPADQKALALIAAGVSPADLNLHVRFHVLEIFEALLRRFPQQRDLRDLVVSGLGRLASSGVGSAPVEGAEPLYADCQDLIAVQARCLTAGSGAVSPPLAEAIQRCIANIDADRRYLELGSGPGLEMRLECWEVTLAFASRACRDLSHNAAYLCFLEAALEHPYWIVRWWAFAGLTQIVADTREDRRVLANRCARRVVERLCCGVEPIGLKYRQAALIDRLLESGDEGPARIVREVLSRSVDESLGPVGRQVLCERYYEKMGASPDLYLSDFFARVDRLVRGAG